MLENEFASIIKPLHFISCLYGLRKYYLYDNIVTKITMVDVLYSLVGVFVVHPLLAYTLVPLANVYDRPIFSVYVIAYSQYTISYVILSFFNYRCSKYNVKLLLKLQAIDRRLYNKKDTKIVRLFVWIICCCLLLVYGSFITLKLLYDPLWNWIRALFILTALIYDVELAYSICTVHYLVGKARRWSQILQVDEKNPQVLQDEIGVALAEMMFKVYEDILEALVLLKKSAQTTVLIHFVIMFVQSLTYIEILILMTQSQSIETVSVISHAYGVSVWVSKAVVTEATFCIACEILYRRIASAQMVVASNINLYNCQTARRFLKNIRRLNEVQFKKLSVCGIFTVDATLPLRMAGLIGDYTVILLQFAFLRS